MSEGDMCTTAVVEKLRLIHSPSIRNPVPKLERKTLPSTIQDNANMLLTPVPFCPTTGNAGYRQSIQVAALPRLSENFGAVI